MIFLFENYNEDREEMVKEEGDLNNIQNREVRREEEEAIIIS